MSDAPDATSMSGGRTPLLDSSNNSSDEDGPSSPLAPEAALVSLKVVVDSTSGSGRSRPTFRQPQSEPLEASLARHEVRIEKGHPLGGGFFGHGKSRVLAHQNDPRSNLPRETSCTVSFGFRIFIISYGPPERAFVLLFGIRVAHVRKSSADR